MQNNFSCHEMVFVQSYPPSNLLNKGMNNPVTHPSNSHDLFFKPSLFTPLFPFNLSRNPFKQSRFFLLKPWYHWPEAILI
ncbi:hypothetical protein QTO17_20695, partial [Vibrio owensii]